MTAEQKKEIIAYLQGTRDHAEGVALYQKYGVNLRLKRQFAVDDTTSVHEILIEELSKLAGLTTAELLRLPRLAKVNPAPTKTSATAEHVYTGGVKPDEAALMELADSFGVTVDELVSLDFQERVLAMEDNEERIDELTDELELARSKYAVAPEPVRKMIRFRERYPFLNSPECPDVLKVLVSDMFTAYGEYKAAHARLMALGDADSATAVTDCEKVVTEYLKNREIWEELDYYHENGTILGKAAKFREMEAVEDLSKLTDVELMAKLQSAQVQESKARKKVEKLKSEGTDYEEASAALERWSTSKAMYKTELQSRKKK